jgi:hypothetical protein
MEEKKILSLCDYLIPPIDIGIYWAYYHNIDTSGEFARSLGIEGELFSWSFGGLPEISLGMTWIRGGYLLSKTKIGEKACKYLNSKIKKTKIGNKINKSIEGMENYAISSFISITSIMTLGIIDEIGSNISGGTQDPWDILKYALGVGTTAYCCYKQEKRLKDINK